MALPEETDLAALAEAEVKARVSTPTERPSLDSPIPSLAPRDLLRFGLPSRPDSGTSPKLSAFLTDMFSPVPRFLVRGENFDIRFRTVMRHTMGGEGGGSFSRATGAISGRWGTSRNWSGAVIAARDAGRFTKLVGAWTVPRAAAPASPAALGPLPGGVYKQSVWIGLDGYRLCSRSLPQTGTVSLFDPQKAEAAKAAGEDYQGEYYLWAQWWVRDKFYGEAVIDGFDIKAGDRIRATLEVMAPDDVKFVVVNKGNAATNPTPISVTINWAAGTYGDKDTGLSGRLKPQGEETLARGTAPVEGQHAVWCVERPSVMPPKELLGKMKPHEVEAYRIPAFGEVVFTEALAEMRLPDGTPIERDLKAARHIRMIEPGGAPVPRVTFATSPLAPARGGGMLTVRQV